MGARSGTLLGQQAGRWGWRRRWASTVLVGAMLAAALPAAGEAAASRVLLNGHEVPLAAPPLLQSARILVPLRPIAEAMGIEVGWDPTEQRVTAARGKRLVELWVGREMARIDGESVTIDVPPAVVGGRTYVPLRFLGEALGAVVHWDGAQGAVYVTAGGVVEPAALDWVVANLHTTPRSSVDMTMRAQGEFFTPENHTTQVQVSGRGQVRGADRLTRAQGMSSGAKGSVEWYQAFAAFRGFYFVQALPGAPFAGERSPEEDALGATGPAIITAVERLLQTDQPSAQRRTGLVAALSAARTTDGGDGVVLTFRQAAFAAVREMDLPWIGGPPGYPGLEAVQVTATRDGGLTRYELLLKGTGATGHPYQFDLAVEVVPAEEAIRYPELPRPGRRQG